MFSNPSPNKACYLYYKKKNFFAKQAASLVVEGNSRFCKVALGIPKIPGNSHGFPGIPMDSREFPVVLGIQARRRSSREDSPKWGIEVHH
jgi:hypothetical protein